MTKRENKKWIWHNSGAIVTTARALITFKNPSKQSVAKAKLQEQERKYKCMYLLENVPFTNKPLNTWPLDKILLISPCSELCNLHKQQKESKDTKDKKKKINIFSRLPSLLHSCSLCHHAALLPTKGGALCDDTKNGYRADYRQPRQLVSFYFIISEVKHSKHLHMKTVSRLDKNHFLFLLQSPLSTQNCLSYMDWPIKQ